MTAPATLPFFDVHTEEDLASLVMWLVGQPLDAYHVAVLLEMNGVRDYEAQQTFYHENVFALAETVYRLCQEIPPRVGSPVRMPRGAVLKDYMQQLGYQLPLLVQVAALIGLGYSLIYYTGFSVLETSNVVLASLLSLIAVGGMLANPGALRRFWWGMPLLLVLYTGLAVGGYALNQAVGYIHPVDASIIATYFVLLAGYWLSLGLFYTLQARWLPLLVSLSAMTVTISIMEFTDLGIYYAHWLGLGTIIVLSLPYILTHHAPIYPFSGRHFVYGTGYFVILAVDRLIAGHSSQAFFRVHLAYEIGWLLGFVPFLFAVALLAHMRQRLMIYLYNAQLQAFGKLPAYRHQFWRLYWGGWLMCAGLYLTVFLAISPLIPGSARPIFLWAVAGNALLLWSLFNIAMSHTLTRWIVVSLLLAILITAVSGYSLSQQYDYRYSIIGLAIGSGCWMLGTSWVVRQQWLAMDYYLYRNQVVL